MIPGKESADEKLSYERTGLSTLAVERERTARSEPGAPPRYQRVIRMTNFVFLHVGADPYVELLVHSIRKTNPNARVIQCTDKLTEKVHGTTEIYRHNGDTSNLMTFRLEAFSALRLQEPAIYLDTDMIVLGEISPEAILKDSQVICCKRSFERDSPINTSFRGMDLSEYQHQTLAEVYPIIACFTITEDSSFWLECFEDLIKLDQKFHRWYGDQEAMRNVASSGKFRINYLPESHIACLPEFAQKDISPLCLHVNGGQRKVWMKEIFDEVFNP